jgi:sodium pump decarboxylase gamma subunit
MEELTLLQKFVDSELIRGLSAGDKTLATFYVTVMGMAITFTALIILWGCISLLAAIFKPGRKKKAGMKEPDVREISETARPAPIETETNEGECIAAITAALAAALDTPVPTIRVKSIFRQYDPTPQWGKVGRIEQLIGN